MTRRRLRGTVLAAATVLATCLPVAGPAAGQGGPLGPGLDLPEWMGTDPGRSWDLPPLDEEWRWSDYVEADGLPPGDVLAMAEDGATVWVATAGGVAFFDGFEWRPVPGLGAAGRIRDVHALPGTPVAIASEEGLFVGDTAGVAPVDIPGEPRNQGVVAVAWNDPGTLVFETDPDPETLRGTYYLRRNGIVSRLRIPGLPVWSGRRLHHTAGGRVYLAARDGLYRFRPPNSWGRVVYSAEQLYGIERVEANLDGEGVASLVTPRRTLVTWEDGAPADTVTGEGDNRIISTAVTPDGLRLVLHDTGDLRARTGDGWIGLRVPSSRRQRMRYIFAGHTGDIWIQSVRGLHLFRRLDPRWTRVDAGFPSRRNRVNDIAVSAADSTIWLGTAGGLVALRDRHPDYPVLAVHDQVVGTGLPYVTGVAVDSAGGVWAVSGSGFPGAVRLDSDGGRRYLGPEDGLGLVHDVAVDAGGRVYFLALEGGNGPGAYRLDPDGRLEHLQDPAGVLKARTYSFAQAPDGAAWFGSAAGIARLRDGRWRSWTVDDLAVPVDRIWTLAFTTDGTLLVGTGVAGRFSLYGFDPVRGTLARISDGPPQDGPPVQDIEVAGDGTVWVSDTGGLRLRSGSQWIRMDGRHGLGGAWVWPVRHLGDRVLAGTAAGLVVLSLRERNDPPPRIRLRADLVGRDDLHFSWTPLSYRGRIDPEQIETRFALGDGEFTPWRTVREARYLDLDPGRYPFRVQARGLFGQVSEISAAELRIPTPFYRHPLFTIPVLILTGVLVALGIQIRNRRAERDRAVRASEGRLRALLEQAPEAILIYEPGARIILEANEQAHLLLGRTVEELRHTTPMSLSPERQPDGAHSARKLQTLARDAVENDRSAETEWIFLSADGREVPTELRVVRLPEPESHLVRLSVLDRTEQKAAEATRAQLEVQLVQAQKLEAVGQLTGGVAHDFNNLLTVILGNLDFIRDHARDGEVRKFAQEALTAAESGSQLVKSLLAFSARQSLAPVRVGLDTVLSEMLPLLRRTLGRDIEIQTEVDSDLPGIQVDRAQLDSAIMNLGVNARDAMPGGGRLAISVAGVRINGPEAAAAEVEPGRYVRLTVADTGTGIAADVLERVFEPFFTTKPVGKGTGLGLSMVYGFARQSGGFAQVTSEEGRGTAVHLYFPALPDPRPAAVSAN